jgi:hypothetical protein
VRSGTLAWSRRSSHAPRDAIAARSSRSPPSLKIARSSTGASGRPFTRDSHSHVGAPLGGIVRTPRHTPTVVPTHTSSGNAGSQTIAVTGAGTPPGFVRSPVACHALVPSNHQSVSTPSTSGWPTVPT